MKKSTGKILLVEIFKFQAYVPEVYIGVWLSSNSFLNVLKHSDMRTLLDIEKPLGNNNNKPPFNSQ